MLRLKPSHGRKNIIELWFRTLSKFNGQLVTQIDKISAQN